METVMAILDSPWLKVFDLAISIYLVYYYISNEYKKGNLS
jgi:hypothetical protein